MRTLLLSLILLTLHTTASAIKPMRAYQKLPDEYGLEYSRLDVRTKDGYRIETWFYPAQCDKKDTRRPTLIICNGDAGNMSYFQIALAHAYTRKGFHVVTFDWRGFGASDPFEMNPNYLCYTEMLLDYDAVIRETAHRKEVDTQRIFCLGWSTGGYLTLIAAHRNAAIKGVIVRGVPTRFEDTIPLLKAQSGKTDENLIVPEDFPIGEMPLDLAPRFHKPIMLIVGEHDRRTPPWMARAIYDALPAGTIKRLLLVEGAEHGGDKAPETVDFEQFITETSAFIRNPTPQNGNSGKALNHTG